MTSLNTLLTSNSPLGSVYLDNCLAKMNQAAAMGPEMEHRAWLALAADERIAPGDLAMLADKYVKGSSANVQA